MPLQIVWIASLMPKKLKRAEEEEVDLVALKEEISRLQAPLRHLSIYLLGLARLLSRKREFLDNRLISHFEEPFMKTPQKRRQSQLGGDRKSVV